MDYKGKKRKRGRKEEQINEWSPVTSYGRMKPLCRRQKRLQTYHRGSAN
jgi:hypothetical protein